MKSGEKISPVTQVKLDRQRARFQLALKARSRVLMSVAAAFALSTTLQKEKQGPLIYRRRRRDAGADG